MLQFVRRRSAATWWAVFAIVSIAAFAYVCVVVGRHGWVTHADGRVLHWATQQHRTWLRRTAKVIRRTMPPSTIGAWAIVLSGVWSITRRDWRPLVVMLGCVLGVSVAVLLTKSIVVPHPPALRGAPRGSVFPSGHTAIAGAVVGALAVLAGPRRPVRMALSALLAAAVTIFVGSAMVVTRAHWLSDAIGGGLAAAAVVGVVGWADAVWPSGRQRLASRVRNSRAGASSAART
ncbi:MAG: phosphatase PAP2 family protein [Actinomycetes bacterium]